MTQNKFIKILIPCFMLIFLFVSFPFTVNAASGESSPSFPTMPYTIGSIVPEISQEHLNLIKTELNNFDLDYLKFFIIDNYTPQSNNHVFNIFLFSEEPSSTQFSFKAGSYFLVSPLYLEKADGLNNFMNYKNANILAKLNLTVFRYYYFVSLQVRSDGSIYKSSYPGGSNSQRTVQIFGHPREDYAYPVFSNFGVWSGRDLYDITYSFAAFGYIGFSDSNVGSLGSSMSEWLDGYQGGDLDLPDGIWDSEPVNESDGLLRSIFNRLGKMNNNILSGFSALFNYFSSGTSSGSGIDLNPVTKKINEVKEEISSLRSDLSQTKEDISSLRTFFMQPISVEDSQDQIQELYPYSLFVKERDTLKSLWNNVKDVQAPSTLVYALDFSNSSSSIVSSFGVVYLDFSWYSSIREHFINWFLVLIYIDFILCLFCDIPDIIHGLAGGGKNYD